MAAKLQSSEPETSVEDQQVIREFLIESAENLAQVECSLVDPENPPGDPTLLAGILRTIHTVKGRAASSHWPILIELAGHPVVEAEFTYVLRPAHLSRYVQGSLP